jgi:hypothetical protein
MVGQSISDRRSSRRERDARYDAFRIKRFETDREALLALQELLNQHVPIVTRILHEAAGPLSENHEVIGMARKITTLAHRCLDDKVCDDVLEYIGVSLSILSVPPEQRSDEEDRTMFREDIKIALDRATKSLRAAIRQDPLEKK